MKVDEEKISKALQILKRYKDDSSLIRSKIIENEEWYKARHWKEFKTRSSNSKDPEPVSAWLVNTLHNKHADAMDNYPSPVFLPREESDSKAANELSEIVPVILEQNDFETSYANNWWYKLKNGTAVYGVFWNPKLQNGLGDIAITRVDVLNIFWEAGVTDIQQSPNVFTLELIDNKLAKKLYGDDIDFDKSIETYKYFTDENVDTTRKSLVVDWYYKKLDKNGNTILHYCKFIGNKVIVSSENENPDKPYYDHNMYPFVLDVLFPEEGTAFGYGYIDLMKDTQMYIDRMQQTILKNTISGSRRRFFVSQSCNVNLSDFADSTKEIIQVAGNVSDDKIREITTRALDDIYVSVLNNKIEEMKETSGNRDFQQGGVANGVTAASAIAALQESGSKLSRDMIRSSYRSYNKIMQLVLEDIRQFYDSPRKFRITNNKGNDTFITYTNDSIKPATSKEFGYESVKLPIFDIKIKAQKANPFSQASANEEAKTLFQMGFFNPQLADQSLVALEMMSFEGKDKVVKSISQNGLLIQQVAQLQQQMQQMASIIQRLQGTDLSGSVAAAGNEAMSQGRAVQTPNEELSVNQLGRAYKFAKRDRTDAARAQSVDATAIK